MSSPLGALANLADTIVIKDGNVFMVTMRDGIRLAADIYRRGLYLTGGGGLLRGLDKRISHKIKLPVQVADDPLRAVVRGTGMALKNTAKMPFLMK